MYIILCPETFSPPNKGGEGDDCLLSELTALSSAFLTTIKVKKWLAENADSKHAAVYAVAGKDEAVKFVGVSRNVALSVAAHVANEGDEKVHLLKVIYTTVNVHYSQYIGNT